jgi:enolase
VPVLIDTLHGREILDSRGRPTVEVEVGLSDGSRATASVPSGASTGRHEAVELRDRDDPRYGGAGVRGVARAIDRLIAPSVAGRDAFDQEALDELLRELDGTADKSRLGANALLGVSLAVARAAAISAGLPLWRYLGGANARVLPLPMVNMISGGLHAQGGVDFQDFLVIPTGASTYSQALEMSVAVYAALGRVLSERGLSTLKADEGGFGPALRTNSEALEVLLEAVEHAGLREHVAFGMDVAASHLYEPSTGVYRLRSDHAAYDAPELVELLAGLVERYPIVSIEDGLAEDDWDGWRLLSKRLGTMVQLVGDDLFATNLRRLERGIEAHAANAILVKMNQIGTLSETLEVVRRAQRAGVRTIVSARSGETEDPAIADLAVATNAGQIKVGSVAQSDRLAKYNQLLRIEEDLAEDALFAGRDALWPAT